MSIDAKAILEDIYAALSRHQGSISALAMRVKALCQQFGFLDTERRVHEERLDSLDARTAQAEEQLAAARQELSDLKQNHSRLGMH